MADSPIAVAPAPPPLTGPVTGPTNLGSAPVDLMAAFLNLEAPVPLFMSSATLALFAVVPATDSPPNSKPYFRPIPKLDILADLRTRAAVSDFTPAKKLIADYPADELILVHDADWSHGQNYYLLASPAAADAFLRTMNEAHATAAAVINPARPQCPSKWISQGSDKEIEVERLIASRLPIRVKVSRRRREFGAPVKFGDRDASDGLLECRPFRDPSYEILRTELCLGIQAIPDMVHASAQTAWFRPVNFGVQYTPIEMDEPQREELLLTQEMDSFARAIFGPVDSALQLNEIMDIFNDDYAYLGDDDMTLEQGAHSALQEFQSFTDLRHSKDRSISCIDWHPSQKGVVAISCTSRSTFDEKLEVGMSSREKQSLILIWSFNDPIHPQLILEAPDDINCLQFNPLDHNLIAGGSVSGQIVLWDISNHQDKLKLNRRNRIDGDDSKPDEKTVETSIIKYIVVSSIEASHRAPVSDLRWLPKHFELNTHTAELLDNAENGQKQLVTTSLDGQVFFWDLRHRKELKALDLVWRPFWRIPLASMDNTFDYGLTKISLNTNWGEKVKSSDWTLDQAKKVKEDKSAYTKFYCATEEGDLLYSDWYQEKSSEEKASRVEVAFPYHFGPMNDLQRSPFFPDILLSVGGWSFHIWKEKVLEGPLLTSAPSVAYLTSGKWSPTRPGVFYLSRADGVVEIWDLLDRSHLPSHIQNVSSTAISYMSINSYQSKGHATTRQFVATGDDDGTLHILEVPRNLTKTVKNEKSFVRAFFDREVKRLNYVKQRVALRIKEKSSMEQTPGHAASDIKSNLGRSETQRGGSARLDNGASAVKNSSGSGAVNDASDGGLEQEDPEAKAFELDFLKMEKSFLELFGGAAIAG